MVPNILWLTFTGGDVIMLTSQAKPRFHTYECLHLCHIFFLLRISAGAVLLCSVVFEIKEYTGAPSDWNIIGRPAPVSLCIFLPQSQFLILKQNIQKVSDSDHVQYGMHLSKEDVEKLVSSHADTLSVVD